MASRTQTPEWVKWLRAANKFDLAGLTGADYRVLGAIDACWQALPTVDRREDVLGAVRSLLPAMQEKYWPLAKELIARAMDWGHRDEFWPQVEPERGPECDRCGAVGGEVFDYEGDFLCEDCHPVVKEANLREAAQLDKLDAIKNGDHL